MNLVSFCSYKVYEVTVERDQVELMQEWEDAPGIDFWTHPRVGHPAKIMVSPELEQSFVNFLVESSISHKLTIPDVEAVLRKEKEEHEHRRSKRSVNINAVDDAAFDYFWTFDEMETYAKLLAETYPNTVKLENIGQTIEGRNMFALKFSTSLSTFGEKPIIFIDAGTHAR